MRTDCLLRQISRSQAMLTRNAIYTASLGRRRSYLSESDAHAYDRGYRTFPAAVVGPINTPFSCGWLDANDG